MFYPSEEMEVSKHFVHKCMCGRVVIECGCKVKVKRVSVIKDRCDECKDKKGKELC